MNANFDLSGSENTDPAIHAMAERVLAPGQVTTWLNHWSLINAQWSALTRMTTVGIDGTLLQMAFKKKGIHVERTSADLVMPVALKHYLPNDATVVLIGAAPGVATQAKERLTPLKVVTYDGYTQLQTLRDTHYAQMRTQQPRLVIIGLGAGLQETVADEVSRQLPNASICTAGGWIDQLSQKEQYFPPIVHQLRLGWLWRIAHEPRRLLGRYTIDAVRFTRRSNKELAKISEHFEVDPAGAYFTRR